jgi:hypothetical protein
MKKHTSKIESVESLKKSVAQWAFDVRNLPVEKDFNDSVSLYQKRALK